MNMQNKISFEGGSYKDPEGRVAYENGRVFRLIATNEGAERVKGLLNEPFIQNLQDQGKIARTWICKEIDLPQSMKDYPLVLEHEKVPFVTYPYEWSFSQLRDAALLTLEIMEAALEAGYSLKDATPFNVMPFGSQMKHIDFLSFEKPDSWMGWVGYRQFCQEFLYPLVAAGKMGLDFRSLMRGYFTGINATEMLKMVGKWRAVRFGLTRHLVLAATFEKQFTNANTDIEKSIQQNELGPDLVKNNIKSLIKSVQKIKPFGITGTWSDYEEIKTYTDETEKRKDAFVEKAVQDCSAAKVIDLGCNTGRYSDISAKYCNEVISVDLDPDCIDTLYCRNRNHNDTKITSLVGHLGNPAGGMGWANNERKSLMDRMNSDLVLSLALVHHIRISSNVPFDLIFKAFAEIGNHLVIEWVDREDSMVKLLLKNRKDIFNDYNQETFETALKDYFDIIQTESLGTRTLYFTKRK